MSRPKASKPIQPLCPVCTADHALKRHEDNVRVFASRLSPIEALRQIATTPLALCERHTGCGIAALQQGRNIRIFPRQPIDQLLAFESDGPFTATRWDGSRAHSYRSLYEAICETRVSFPGCYIELTGTGAVFRSPDEPSPDDFLARIHPPVCADCDDTGCEVCAQT